MPINFLHTGNTVKLQSGLKGLPFGLLCPVVFTPHLHLGGALQFCSFGRGVGGGAREGGAGRQKKKKCRTVVFARIFSRASLPLFQ